MTPQNKRLKKKFPFQASLLAGLREKSGQTLVVFSQAIGIERTTWYRLERGQRELTLDEAYRISRMFGTEVFSANFLENHNLDSKNEGDV